MDRKDYIHIQNKISTVLGDDRRIEFIHGVFSAALCAPEIIPPSVWLPLMLEKDGEEIEFTSMDIANEVVGTLMGLYNDIAKSLADGEFYPLFSHTKAPGKGQLQMDPDTAQLWCSGFVGGLGLWETDFVPDEKVRGILTPIFLIVDTDDVIEENPEIPVDLIKKLKKESVTAVAESVAMLREYYLKRTKAVKTHTGRNEPCPCGSGKKYKKCCGII
ncbi:MAG: hypothetical protein CVV44_17275 [Spirochaetae bacterium HGW-Spirochaetae-1]|jgi:uncharacterized protein|nr:MAG: hypothetical protein CVV44_17275 [Spirochaetae bacterium HGW-Spirochaetae-1]